VKLAAGRVEAFLRRPDPEIRAILLYGPDAGLVRERAETVARTICPDLRDPFRVAELTAATLIGDPARLADEAAQISLMGGRRVIRVREAGDTLAPLFARFLPAAVGDTLVVAEAGQGPLADAWRRLEPALARALDLGLSVYDASYLTLAEVADAVLVTADGQLAQAAVRAELIA